MSDPSGGPEPSFRDPRRLFTPAQRAEIAARQHHVCAHCGIDLVDGEWDAHHVVRHTDGGPTLAANGVGLCRDCHAHAEIVDSGFTPRLWQAEARPSIYSLLRRWRFATLNAAPGAGKTQFAGWLYRLLAEAGEVERLIVMVPYRHLCTQWAEALATNFGVHLADNDAAERRGQHGVVLTYQSVPQRLSQLIADAAESPTLVVLDEVHHLGFDPTDGAAAWGYAVAQLVGDTDNPKMPVLNLTGTLFRSKRQERICTVRYVATGGAIESVADYTIPASQLITDGVLRYIRLLGFDQDMTVHGIELEEAAHEGAANIRAIDLDKVGKRERTSIINTLIRNDDYIAGMLRQTVEELRGATIALGGASPIKGLVIADDVSHARQVHANLRDLGYGDVSYIAVGEDGVEADRTIDRFRKQTRPSILVAVQKVTEGFDVPDVAVLTYLKTWCAPLFINQMSGRVMRVTRREQEVGQRLPATILIPDDPEIRAAFADVLVGSMRLLEAPKEPCASCGREICACPLYKRLFDKTCARCHQPERWCVCMCRFCHQPRRPRCACPPGTCWACGEIPCVCDHRQRLEDVSIDLLGELENTSSTVNGRTISDMLLRNRYKAKLLEHGKNPQDADLLVAVVEAATEEQPWLASDGGDMSEGGDS